MDTVLKLRELRRLCGLSQEKSAKLAGIGVKTLSSFETGARISSMKMVQLFSLLQVYRVTPAEFFGGKVEETLFGELEHLEANELTLIRELRLLDRTTRARLEEKFLTMIESVRTVTRPAPLRAVL